MGKSWQFPENFYLAVLQVFKTAALLYKLFAIATFTDHLFG